MTTIVVVRTGNTEGPHARRTVLLRLDDTEYDALVDAAASAGLTPSGFAAEAVVAVTQRTALPEVDPVRVLLQELMHIRTQIRRHGCDVQQALREPTAGGYAPDRLTETVELSNHASHASTTPWINSGGSCATAEQRSRISERHSLKRPGFCWDSVHWEPAVSSARC